MMKIQLPNGNTIQMSLHEYLFMLSDDDMDQFYQTCLADDLGSYIDDPFNHQGSIDRVTLSRFKYDDYEPPKVKGEIEEEE